MLNMSMATIAFLFLAAFLGILAWMVPRTDLGAVVLFTLLLTAYDMYVANKKD